MSKILKGKCDGFVATSAEHEKERGKLEEALVIAKKDAIDSTQKAATVQV